MKKGDYLKTGLLKAYRRTANNKLGVFVFNDGTYNVIFDKTMMNDVSKFREDEYKYYQEAYGYQLVKSFDNLEDAKEYCILCRRQYILDMVRGVRYGNKKRFF